MAMLFDMDWYQGRNFKLIRETLINIANNGRKQEEFLWKVCRGGPLNKQFL